MLIQGSFYNMGYTVRKKLLDLSLKVKMFIQGSFYYMGYIVRKKLLDLSLRVKVFIQGSFYNMVSCIIRFKVLTQKIFSVYWDFFCKDN